MTDEAKHGQPIAVEQTSGTERSVVPEIQPDTTGVSPCTAIADEAAAAGCSAHPSEHSPDAIDAKPGTASAPAYTDIHVQRLDQQGGPNLYSIRSVSPAGTRRTTQRRFDDLVTLHESLKRLYRGCVIPFRPGKTVTNATRVRGHTDSFLQQRAYAIQQYLERVVRNPELSQSEVLKQFMESSEVLRESAEWVRQQPRRQSMLGGLVASMRKMAGSEQRIPTPSQVESGNGKTEHDLVRQMAEGKVNRKKLREGASETERRLHDLEGTVAETIVANQHLTSAAHGLVEHARALHNAHIDLGAAFENVRKCEETVGAQRPPELAMRSDARDGIVALMLALNACVNKRQTEELTRVMAIMEPISDHALMLPRVEKALAARLDALVVLESLRRQQGVISAAYRELQAREASNAMSNSDVRRMNRVRGEQDQIAQAIEAAERVYERMCTRNERDIEHYMAERGAAFRDLLVRRLADARAAQADAIAGAWIEMVRVMDGESPVSKYGPDLSELQLRDLGFQASVSALFESGYLASDGDAPAVMSGVPTGSLPEEHALSASGGEPADVPS